MEVIMRNIFNEMSEDELEAVKSDLDRKPRSLGYWPTMLKEAVEEELEKRREYEDLVVLW
jgi:hypothetical protein